MSEKLQKVLSRMGLGSRRGLEKMIFEGRITCNGVQAKIGDRIDADNTTVKIDGKVVLSPSTVKKPVCRVLMYHKPEGELTTLNDPEDRPTVFDHLPKPEQGRWIYVGRLDINTSGLLLFTTDGDLANALMHPRHGIERIYAARIYGEVTDEMLDNLQKGVMLEDGKAHFDNITYVGGESRNAWYHVSLKEGRKREVRRLWEAVGVRVSRLIRISYGGIALDPALKAGQYRELNLNELNKLRAIANLEPLSTADMPEKPFAGGGAYRSDRRRAVSLDNKRRLPGSLGNANFERSKAAVLMNAKEDEFDVQLQANRPKLERLSKANPNSQNHNKQKMGGNFGENSPKSRSKPYAKGKGGLGKSYSGKSFSTDENFSFGSLKGGFGKSKAHGYNPYAKGSNNNKRGKGANGERPFAKGPYGNKGAKAAGNAHRKPSHHKNRPDR